MISTEVVCPGCKNPIGSEEHLPFCCEKCKLADLSRWFREEYKVAAVEVDQEDLDAVIAELEQQGN